MFIEDIWVDCITKEDIRKLDYYHHTKDQIINLNLANLPDDLVDDGNVLDPIYETTKISNTPLPFI